MVIGFVIWTLVAILYLGIGISTWNSKKEAGFFSGTKPPKMRDVAKYNHAVGKLWFVSAAVFEVIGLPLLFAKQNSPIFLLMVVPMMLWVIGMVLAYLRIEKKYREPESKNTPPTP